MHVLFVTWARVKGFYVSRFVFISMELLFHCKIFYAEIRIYNIDVFLLHLVMRSLLVSKFTKGEFITLITFNNILSSIIFKSPSLGNSTYYTNLIISLLLYNRMNYVILNVYSIPIKNDRTHHSGPKMHIFSHNIKNKNQKYL